MTVKVGQKYGVQLEDCCLGVYFEAVLTYVKQDDGTWIYEFSNGVSCETYDDGSMWVPM